MYAFRKVDVTNEEKEAIDALEDIEDNWPKSLWLFSAGGTLYVMKKDKDNNRAILPSGRVDDEYIVESIVIENDGGDW